MAAQAPPRCLLWFGYRFTRPFSLNLSRLQERLHMSASHFTDAALHAHLDAGHSQADAARHFGVKNRPSQPHFS